MDLGAFSVGLAVRDIAASRAFYEKFGFTVFGGDQEQHWLILKNGDAVIGLFQGMLERNVLTFNPGWDGNAQTLTSFTDVRELQRQLKAQGVELVSEADETTFTKRSRQHVSCQDRAGSFNATDPVCGQGIAGGPQSIGRVGPTALHSARPSRAGRLGEGR
jgi:catechol 2,3-dioxygenase-like lactoylglutathione lyase family enzyme